MEAQLATQLIKAATLVEQKLDEEMSKLDNLDDDEIEEIRKKRVAEMRKIQDKRQQLLSYGHGNLTELSGDKDFIEAGKKSPKLVCHFYKQQTEKCQAVDKALEKLATANFFTRFVKVNADRSPFLVERLRLKSIPVIAIVVNEKIRDYIRLADKLEQSVGDLERTIEQKLFEVGAIEKVRPTAQPKTTIIRKGIRGHESDNSDSDN